MTNDQLEAGFRAIAKNLRDFGYQHVTTHMISEVHNKLIHGEPLPYGVVGMFAKSQLENLLKGAN